MDSYVYSFVTREFTEDKKRHVIVWHTNALAMIEATMGSNTMRGADGSHYTIVGQRDAVVRVCTDLATAGRLAPVIVCTGMKQPGMIKSLLANLSHARIVVYLEIVILAGMDMNAKDITDDASLVVSMAVMLGQRLASACIAIRLFFRMSCEGPHYVVVGARDQREYWPSTV